MLENARKYGFIPEEVYSERSKTADDGTLAKVLFQDVVEGSVSSKMGKRAVSDA